MSEKTYACKVNNSWMASIESAFISVTSPSGKSVTITKWYMSEVKEQPQIDAVWKCANEQEIVELTFDEMAALKAAALLARREKIEKEPCSHRGTKRTKDHGTWTGWYCTNCGEGGSYGKKNTTRRRGW